MRITDRFSYSYFVKEPLFLRFLKFATNVLCEVRDTLGNKTGAGN